MNGFLFLSRCATVLQQNLYTTRTATPGNVFRSQNRYPSWAADGSLYTHPLDGRQRERRIVRVRRPAQRRVQLHDGPCHAGGGRPFQSAGRQSVTVICYCREGRQIGGYSSREAARMTTATTAATATTRSSVVAEAPTVATTTTTVPTTATPTTPTTTTSTTSTN